MTEGFLQYGVLGLVVLALGSYVIKIEQRHRKERKELQEERKEMMKMNENLSDKMIESNDENNKVIREHTNVLSALKTLLENQRRNGR